ncbi:carbohydrate-binding module family 18 protein [Plenodomus tracheiphilus IPT5]|uniref:Carbohydrate-binding module family 18 protein n=1 Tax=Plenodomus tracheiphilus IPT5 TaxID=1408161 RepID=A0A6A7B6S1_9PLEO|nr:carbohydrate-binding module family 18 protein [Plenodomus tracheiphilus IPT5]
MRPALIWALTTLTTASALSISTTARCGSDHGGLTCAGSTFGNCCSKYGYCGSNSDYCSPKKGCQSRYGKCDKSPDKPAGAISTDGSCGGKKGSDCRGSKFGDCCSQYGYCGSSAAYCGIGCNNVFGSCSSAHSSSRVVSPSQTYTRSIPAVGSRSSSATAASSTPKISKNNRCGYGNSIASKYLGQTCPSGQCCSQYGYCGKFDAYCGAKCQSAFGKCNSKSSTVHLSSTASATKHSSPVVTSSSKTYTSSAISTVSSSDVVSSSSIIPLSSSDVLVSSSVASSATTSASSSASASPSSSDAAISSSSAPSDISSSASVTASSSSLDIASSSSSTVSDTSSSSSSEVISSSSTVALSSSSNIASSSSSATPSSSSDVATSSSTAASTTLATAVSSSTDSSSVTTSASSSVSCFPAPTEYLINPGFEITTDGSYRNPWTDSQNGKGYTFNRATGSDVYYSIYTRNENNFRTYFGTTKDGTDGAKSSTLILTQTLSIPRDTVISVTAWVKSLRDASIDPFTMVLRFDDVTVATYSPTQNQRGVWTQIGTMDPSQGIIVSNAGTHSVSLRVTTAGFANKDIFAADDFSVTAISGPGGAPVCSTAF